MSVKKTSSPLSSGAESLDPLGGQEELQRGPRVEKNFEAALAEVAGQLDQTGAAGQTENASRSEFQRIASNANLDSPEGVMSAVRETAHFIVSSRLAEDLRDSEQGKKIADDLSGYISKDPYLHRKILNILQRLK
ncbi:MAG: hypothetical protein JSS81_18380 [Acidobacteria bacterium]|nr:hypothetical protein [Acidobacteriota bacterium]